MKARQRRLWAPLFSGSLMVSSLSAQQAPAQPMAQATIAPATRVFGSDTGLVLNFVKPDKTADFEAVVAKLRDALQKSANPRRREQGASWRVYKSAEPAAGGAALYVFIVEPVVKGADYSVTTILAEAFDADELSGLVKQYTESYASGQNIVSLALVSDLGK